MGYSYVSVMYRVCIGYVSGIYRNIRAARGIYLSTMETMIFNNENNEDSTMGTMITTTMTITITMLLLQSEYQGIKGRKRKNKYFFKQKICTCEIFVVILQLN